MVTEFKRTRTSKQPNKISNENIGDSICKVIEPELEEYFFTIIEL